MLRDFDEVQDTIDVLMEVVKETIAEDEQVYLRGFGTFKAKHRGARIARNVKKNLPIEVEAHYFPFFKPSQEFAKKVKFGLMKTKSSHDH